VKEKEGEEGKRGEGKGKHGTDPTIFSIVA